MQMRMRTISQTIGLSGVLAGLEPDNKFELPGWHVWCGSAVSGPDGRYYLLFSRWPERAGFESWVTHSEIAVAVSDRPAGPYRYLQTALGRTDKGWDRHVTHNPAVLKHQGKYYMYYMGTYGPNIPDTEEPQPATEIWWTYRNNQRIGLAVADHPAGPWQRADEPLVDVTPGSWDAWMTSNPSVCIGRDGQIVMMYKGVAEGEIPKGGAVNAGIATAGHPGGPFVKQRTPSLSNPEHPWAVEDPFIWFQDGSYYALVKDFQGYFTQSEPNTIALLESDDAVQWRPCRKALAMNRELTWGTGSKQFVHRLERPQLLLEEGVPVVLFCAVLESPEARSYNVHIPFR